MEVLEADPIRDLIKAKFADGEIRSLPPCHLQITRPQQKQAIKRKRAQTAPHQPPEQPSSPSTTPALKQPSTASSDKELDFISYILYSGLILRVGFVYFIQFYDIPFVVSRIFKCNDDVSVSCFRCKLSLDKQKVIGYFKDFKCILSSSYFVRGPSKGEFSFPFSVDINNLITLGVSQLQSCQLANLGDISYLRDLRRHAVGAQMRQAVFSGISLNATKPPQAISLGPFEPLHDHAIFGLSEANNLKVRFSHSDLFKLDSVMGTQWDVKQLRPDAPGFFFKFVTSLSVYVDKKTFTLKFNFTFAQSSFPLNRDYRNACSGMFN